MDKLSVPVFHSKKQIRHDGNVQSKYSGMRISQTYPTSYAHSTDSGLPFKIFHDRLWRRRASAVAAHETCHATHRTYLHHTQPWRPYLWPARPHQHHGLARAYRPSIHPWTQGNREFSQLHCVHLLRRDRLQGRVSSCRPHKT